RAAPGPAATLGHGLKCCIVRLFQRHLSSFISIVPQTKASDCAAAPSLLPHLRGPYPLSSERERVTRKKPPACAGDSSPEIQAGHNGRFNRSTAAVDGEELGLI